MIGDLSKRYESNGDAGCISNGYGDAGGKSYGMYQLSSNMGVVDDYIRWLRRNVYWFAENLAEHPVGSLAFDEAWRWLAYSNNKADFEKSQHDYICDAYYKPAVAALKCEKQYPKAAYEVNGYTDKSGAQFDITSKADLAKLVGKTVWKDCPLKRAQKSED